jgi:putative ABC transport system permease protein
MTGRLRIGRYCLYSAYGIDLFLMTISQLLRSFQLGLRSLKSYKLRSCLTVLGVVFGTGSVIIMLAVGTGARREAIEAINALGSTNIILRSVKPTNLDADRKNTGAIRYGITLREISQFRIHIPSVAGVAAMRERQLDIHFDGRRLSGRVVGVTPKFRDLSGVELDRGRFIEDLDDIVGDKVAVLGAELAATLFPIADPVGQSVRIGEDRYYRVIGVARSRAKSPSVGGGLPSRDFNRDIYIPFSTDQKRFGENVVVDRTGSQPPEKVEVSQVIVSVDDVERVKATAQIISTMIAANGKEDEISMTVPLDLLEKAEQTQRMFTLVLTAIASISLLVGGIGIMNIMLATVTERTREIGIRRALGARRSDIVWQFLVETIVLSGLGGVLGVCAGIAGAFLAARLGGIPTQVQAWSAVLGFGISVLVGLIFGLYPARRAAFMDPIQALRHE